MKENSPIWQKQKPLCLYGGLQRSAAEGDTDGGREALEDDDREGDDEDGKPVLHKHGGLDEHTHRDEEDGSEEVFQRGHQPMDDIGLDGLAEDGAHHEGS